MSEVIIGEGGARHDLDESLQNFLIYWEENRLEGKLPNKSSMDPIKLRGLLSYIILLEVVAEDEDFKVKICGDELRENIAVPIQGKLWSTLEKDGVVVTQLTTLQSVVMNKEPIIEVAGSMASIDRPHVCFQNVVVPLASDGENVDYLMSAYAYK